MGVGDHTNRHVIRIDSLVGVWCGVVWCGDTGIMGKGKGAEAKLLELLCKQCVPGPSIYQRPDAFLVK
jgi:hypothetical protein